MSNSGSGHIDIDRSYSVPEGNVSDVESSGCGGFSCCGGNTDKETQNESKESVKGIMGTRWSTVVMILLWIVGIIFSSINLGWTKVECDLDHDDDSFIDTCIANSTIYRVTSVVIVLLAFQAIFSMCVIAVYDNYWLLKFLFLCGASAGLLVPASSFFNDNAFIFLSRIGGFIFVIFLQTILLDFAYYWKKSWVDEATATGRMTNASLRGSDLMLVAKNFWVFLLLLVSVFYIVAFIIATSLMLKYFGGPGCADNESIIITSLGLVIAALVLQLCVTSNGSIIASGILAAYGASPPLPSYHIM